MTEPSVATRSCVALVDRPLCSWCCPSLVVAVNAVKSPGRVLRARAAQPARGLYLDGLRDFWQRVDFGQKLLNSVLISGVGGGRWPSSCRCSTRTRIGIGRIRGRTWVLAFFVLANMLPQEALVYPLYYLSKQVGLYDTRLSVIIVFTVIQAAFGTYLLSSVLGALPAGDHRGRADRRRRTGGRCCGGSWCRSAGPRSAVLLVFFFIWTWNEFLLPLVMLISNDNQTVSVALGVLQGQRLMDAT